MTTVTVSQWTSIPGRRLAAGWLQSPLWDGFWILSGLWLLAMLIIAHGLDMVPAVPMGLALYASVLLWGGHIVSPIVTAWLNPQFRALIRQQRTRYVAVPLVVIATSTMFGVLGGHTLTAVSGTGGLRVDTRVVLFLAFIAWNTWHFAAQHFGVLSIYRRVAGDTTEQTRRYDRWFTVVSGCVLLPLGWYSNEMVERLGPMLAWAGPPPPGLPRAVVVAACALTLSLMLRELRLERPSVPRLLYLLSIGIQPVFAVIAPAIYYFALITVCHWMIAIGLSARIAHRMTDASVPRIRVPQFAYAAGLVVASVPLYFVLLRPLPLFGTFEPAVHFAYGPGQTSVALGALSGAYFGITFVHFMYDRYVYSFRNPVVRAAIAPHLFGRG